MALFGDFVTFQGNRSRLGPLSPAIKCYCHATRARRERSHHQISYQAVPIQDRVDIDNLFSAYAYTLDDGDADGWIALYTEDGVFDVPGLNRFEGPEGLRGIADIVIQGNWRHIATNVLVTPGTTGDEVAVRLRTLVTDWTFDPAGIQFNDYRGTLVRINGRWRIKELIPTPTKVIV